MGKSFYQAWTENLGRDGWDQPLAIPENMSAESMNVELREGGLGRKRNGSEVVTFTGLTGGGMFALGRFVPGNNSAASELWAHEADIGAGTKLVRIPGGVASGVEVKTGLALPIKYAQLNGKFFITSNLGASVNRMYVYAPNESTTTIRFAGLKPEAAPTVANQGGGAYAAVARTYRVVTKRIVGGVVVSQSEPSATVAFTPSGAGASARVTKGAASGEGETHWEVQGAGSNGIYWGLSGNIVVATTTFDDTVTPSNYPTNGTVPAPLGSNYPLLAAQFILSDGIRLYMLGVWATSQGDSVPPVNGRMYFTPAIGTSDMGDDERINDTADVSGWIDLAIGGGGTDRGLGGPINNAIAAFQANGIYLFVPTNNADSPFRRVVLTTSVGSVSQAAIVNGEDEIGQPALYFLDAINGPYRISSGYSLQWLGKDVKDLWNRANLSVSDPETSFWGSYDSSRKLVIWKITPTSGSSFEIVYDVTNGRVVSGNQVRRGWVQWTEPAGINVPSGIMFNSTLASSRPATLLMHYANPSTASVSLYRQTTTAGLDGATAYLAYVTSKAYRWKPLGILKKLLNTVVVGLANSATTIRATFTSNWGQQTLTQTVSLAPVGSETYVRPRPNPTDFTELDTLQATLGDPTTLTGTSAFELDHLEMKLEDLDEQL